MTTGLLDTLGPHDGPDVRIAGVASAVVVDDADPEGLGRVRLSYPWLSGAPQDPAAAASAWARVAVPMAAAGAGVAFRLAVGDEVLVAFEQGDIRFPYVVGGLWGRERRPPDIEPGASREVQVIRSRAGHTVQLVDTPAGEQIRIADKTGRLIVTLDSVSGRLSLRGADVVVEAEDRLTLSGAEVQIRAAGGVAISSGSALSVTADGPLAIRGAIVDIN